MEIAFVYYGMANDRPSRLGRPFTLDEHRQIFEWNSRVEEGWPRIELALSYPDTPEMLGVVEHGQVGPTIFVWAATWGVIIEPFSGGSYTYPSVTEALCALSKWAEAAVKGRRLLFGESNKS